MPISQYPPIYFTLINTERYRPGCAPSCPKMYAIFARDGAHSGTTPSRYRETLKKDRKLPAGITCGQGHSWT